MAQLSLKYLYSVFHTWLTYGLCFFLAFGKEEVIIPDWLGYGNEIIGWIWRGVFIIIMIPRVHYSITWIFQKCNAWRIMPKGMKLIPIAISKNHISIVGVGGFKSVWYDLDQDKMIGKGWHYTAPYMKVKQPKKGIWLMVFEVDYTLPPVLQDYSVLFRCLEGKIRLGEVTLDEGQEHIIYKEREHYILAQKGTRIQIEKL